MRVSLVILARIGHYAQMVRGRNVAFVPLTAGRRCATRTCARAYAPARSDLFTRAHGQIGHSAQMDIVASLLRGYVLVCPEMPV